MEKTREKMDLWLSQFPESTHPLDERRKFDFVKELCKNHDSVDFEDLYDSYRRHHPDYDEQTSCELCRKWDLEISLFQRFYEYLSEY